MAGASQGSYIAACLVTYLGHTVSAAQACHPLHQCHLILQPEHQASSPEHVSHIQMQTVLTQTLLNNYAS